MKRFLAYIIFCLIFLGLVSPISAQQQTSQQTQSLKLEALPVSVQNVKGNIYQLKGGMGANTGFFIGEKEVLAIDAKMTEDAAKQMIVEIKKLTPKSHQLHHPHPQRRRPGYEERHPEPDSKRRRKADQNSGLGEGSKNPRGGKKDLQYRRPAWPV